MTFPRDRMIALAAAALLGLAAAVLPAATAGAGASARPGGAGAAAAAAALSWLAPQMVTRHPPGAGNNLSCPAATFCALVDGPSGPIGTV